MYILYRQDDAWKFNDKELQRLDIDYNNKAVLAVNVKLFFPYTDDISVSICYYTKDNPSPVFIHKTMVGTPFPNKRVRAAQIKFGRKKTRDFIPILFDSLDELYRVERVVIIWTIQNVEYVISDFQVSFEKSVQKGIYGLAAYDVPIAVLTDNKDEEDIFHIEEDKIVLKSGLGTTYDDFCVFSMYDDEIETILECHTKNSTLNMDDLFDPPDGETTPILQCSFKQLRQDIICGREPFSTKEIITYYRENVVLNDECIVSIL